MFNKNSTSYIFIFALVICALCSLALALVSEGLRPRREMNEAVERQKNILKAAGLADSVRKEVSADIAVLFAEKIEALVIDAKGERVPGILPDQAVLENGQYPLYILKEAGEIQGYVFPISGKGLWSTIYGYLALEPDGVTLKGISFYKHGETPGLGGEIEARWFQQNFQGKKIYDVARQTLRPVRVAKGRTGDRYHGEDLEFVVDGISGATMTGNGITAMLDYWLRVYDPYFQKVRQSQAPSL